MRNILIFSLTLVFIAIGLACGSSFTGGGATPTETYKRLFAAVKSKDTEAIKHELSKKTLAFADFAAGRQKITVEKVLENGLTATTFSESLPEIRDERINADSGSVEVWNSKDSLWEDLPFVKEDGVWKLALGELFGGTFKSPGKGRAMKEREAANIAATNQAPAGNVNTASVTNEDTRDIKVPRPVRGNSNNDH